MDSLRPSLIAGGATSGFEAGLQEINVLVNDGGLIAALEDFPFESSSELPILLRRTRNRLLNPISLVRE